MWSQLLTCPVCRGNQPGIRVIGESSLDWLDVQQGHSEPSSGVRESNANESLPNSCVCSPVTKEWMGFKVKIMCAMPVRCADVRHAMVGGCAYQIVLAGKSKGMGSGTKHRDLPLQYDRIGRRSLNNGLSSLFIMASLTKVQSLTIDKIVQCKYITTTLKLLYYCTLFRHPHLIGSERFGEFPSVS